MRTRKSFKKLLKIAGIALLCAIGGMAIFPVWFPWVLKPFARGAGLRYQAYERNGYGRFTLRHASYTNTQAGIALRADSLQAPVPIAWLWPFKSPSGAPLGKIEVSGVDLLLTSGSAAKPVESQQGLPQRQPAPAVSKVERLVSKLERWLPHTHLVNGTIHSGKTEVYLPELTWDSGQVTAVARFRAPEIQTVVSMDLRSLPYKVQAHAAPQHLILDARVSTNVSGTALGGSIFWHSNRVELAAQFAGSEIVPASGILRSPEFVLPPAFFSIPQYAPLKGSLNASWTNGFFNARVSGSAQPNSDAGLPPVLFGVHVEGNTNEAVIRSAFVDSPWLHADLTRNVSILSKPPWLRDPAQLALDINFDQQPLMDLRGKARANALLTPSESGIPTVRFHLRGQDLARGALQIQSAVMEASLDWPWMNVASLDAEFDPGTKVTLNGRFDFSRKLLRDTNFRLVSPRPLQFMTNLPPYAGLSMSGTLDGALTSPAHNLDLHIDTLSVPGMEPLQVSLNSTGLGMQSSNLVLTLSPAEGVELQAKGSVVAEGKGVRLMLNSLQLSTNGEPVLRSAAPAMLGFVAGSNGQWHAEVRSLAFSSSNGVELAHLEAQVDWPERGSLNATLRDFSPAVAQEFISKPLLPISVNSLAAAATWSNGPVTFQITGAVSGTSTNFPFRGEARIRGDPQAVLIEQAAIVDGPNPLATIQGRLPVSIVPSDPAFLRVDTNGVLSLRAGARPHAALWSRIENITGFTLTDPIFSAELSGKWTKPLGKIEFKAARVTPRTAAKTTPSLSQIDLSIRAEGERAWIENFSLLVQNQPVTVTGEIPLGRDFWRYYKDRTVPDWRKVSGRILMTAAPMSAFEPLAPKILSPDGQIDLDIALLEGGKLDGNITVIGARTDSIDTLGPIRDINLRIDLRDTTARMTQGRARIGGAGVVLKGTADLEPSKLLPGGVPPFQVTVRGERVPLSRQTDSIIRGDLDLLLVGTNGPQPLLAGKVILRDSYFLSDLSALVPGKVADPRRRPPYFSITDKPLDKWRLAVQVEGPRGLKIRSPIFQGETTLNLQLTGTLGDPIAVGDVRVDSGSVRFPFGTLVVQQGLLTAPSQDPAHPTVSMNAAARQFGYDLHMEASGSIDSPVLQFSATPPLTSDQVLLMLTAGELPRGNVSLTPQQRAQTFALFIGRDFLNKLGIAEGESRLTVKSGEDFSDQGRPTYDLEYKLDDRWSLTGEYDRFGDFNAGVKWRVFSK